MTTSDEIFYAVCDCWIWCLSRRSSYGRCGRCGTQPEGSFSDKSDAFNWYYALHGSVPKKMT